MNPGGEDLVLEGATSDDDWVVVFHELNARWPEAILHRVGKGEALLFRDQQEFRRGLAEDGVPQGLVHVIVLPDRLTVVVDQEPTEARRVGLAILESVRASRG